MNRGQPAFRFAAAVLGIAACLHAAGAFAQMAIQSVRGDVRAGSSGQVLMEARENQRLAPGSTVVTGSDAQAVLRFDDGQRVVLNQNTEFRIVDFRYNEARPADDRSVMDLLRGAARFVTGAMGTRNRQAISVRTPQSTIGVRGTDFMLAIVNPLYISVTAGSVAASNAAGTVAFGAGSIASVAAPTALATAIPASALPAAASAAFSNMGAVTISAVGTGVAGGAATGAAAAPAAVGAVGVGTLVGIGAVIAVGVAAASNSNKTESAPTHSK